MALKSGEIVTTSVPLYVASQKKCASGMRVTAGLHDPDEADTCDLKTAAMLSPGRFVAERHVGAHRQVADAGEGFRHHDPGDVGKAEQRRE